MKRRTFFSLFGAGAIATLGERFWPDEGLFNPCLPEATPQHLLSHELVQAAWQGIDTANYWDGHVHVVGTGDSGSGIWLHPDMQDPLHLDQYIRIQFYLNAVCAEDTEHVDSRYVETLTRLHNDFPAGAKFMLLAFDYRYDEQGRRLQDKSAFHIPNDYAASLVKRFPDKFEWIASIHPYREDCVEQLDWAVKHNARAIKWLPPMMGIDPSSPLCDRFYEALVWHKLPLLTHAGDEHAVAGVDVQKLGNPQLLKRALEHGVKVIVAHCATMGSNQDLESAGKGTEVENYQLFARMMDNPAYDGKLFGDISAVAQINRLGPALLDIIQRQEWHHRLVNGSDYPLPGVMPIFSVKRIAEMGLLDEAHVAPLVALRRYNPMLFDFVLKRSMRYQGKAFMPSVFETRKIFII